MNDVPMVDPQYLVNSADIGQEFHVGASTVSNWYQRADKIGMPPPVTTVSNGRIPLWDIRAIRTWWHGWTVVKGSHAGVDPRTCDCEHHALQRVQVGE